MKIIYNKHFPLKGYIAINICGLIFARSEYKPISDTDKHHELIHTRQIIELLFVFFYLWYGLEWLIRLIQYRNRKAAYKNISFEREAYINDHNKYYLKNRKLYSFIHYLKDK